MRQDACLDFIYKSGSLMGLFVCLKLPINLYMLILEMRTGVIRLIYMFVFVASIFIVVPWRLCIYKIKNLISSSNFCAQKKCLSRNCMVDAALNAKQSQLLSSEATTQLDLDEWPI